MAQSGQRVGPAPPLHPGQQPTPEQLRAMQMQLAAEAQKAGLTVPQYIERLKQQAMQHHHEKQQRMQQQTASQQETERAHAEGPQGARPGQQVPIAPGPPKPEALAVASFLRSQNLKMRTCIFQEKRKDMFKVKRAIRALQSPAYAKARAKNPLLPQVKDRVTAVDTFKLLPMSLLALRVSKFDPHEGHQHGKKKKVKGLWTVKVEPQQEAADEYYYVWLYEGSQWRNVLYAVGAVLAILAVVFYPVWPYRLRLGVWYCSMAFLGVVGAFLVMAVFRLILFTITFFVAPPGLWLFPNLWEDVGFFDSFKPVWAWHEDEKTKKKHLKAERERKRAKREAKAAEKSGKKATATAEKNASQKAEVLPTAKSVAKDAQQTQGTSAPPAASPQQRDLSARVEEIEED